MPASGEHTPVPHVPSQPPAGPDKPRGQNKRKSKHSPVKSRPAASLLFLRTMSLKALTGKFFPSPLPSADAFAGQRVIVTGGTAGLGLATAIHFLKLGAEEVIITARSASSARAEGARQKILAAAGQGAEKSTPGKVSVMELDMNSYASCVAFAEAVKGRFGASGPDVIVFNAGVTNSQFSRSPEGMEEIIQVNTLSTTLLALLLVPWMRQQRGQRSTPARIVFVSSGLHMSVDIRPWSAYAEKDGGVLAHYSKAENFEAGLTSPMYNYSKLLLMYALEEVTKIALDHNGEPQVIVTSVCPGPVKTELSRSMQQNSFVARIAAPIFMNLVGKSPDYGARIYLAGALAEPADHVSHTMVQGGAGLRFLEARRKAIATNLLAYIFGPQGKFLRDYLTDAQYASRSAPVLTSKEARLTQAQAWKEIREALSEKVPAAREAL